MHSCIYEGVVSHARSQPVTHRFEYRLAMIYLDLAELESIVGSQRLIGDRSVAPYAFLRSDHLFDSATGLADEVREIVRGHTGCQPTGPVRLLTQLRNWGYYMSPLNLYYVFDDQGEAVEYVVAEVNNTPWNERHCYVLWEGNRSTNDRSLRYQHAKEFHVSPFMDMDMSYHWQLSQPTDQLEVELVNRDFNGPLFAARMTLARRELSRANLRRMALRYPVMTLQITTAIYYQAWKLWWKKCPFYTHPRKTTPTGKLTTMSNSTNDQRLTN